MKILKLMAKIPISKNVNIYVKFISSIHNISILFPLKEKLGEVNKVFY